MHNLNWKIKWFPLLMCAAFALSGCGTVEEKPEVQDTLADKGGEFSYEVFENQFIVYRADVDYFMGARNKLRGEQRYFSYKKDKGKKEWGIFTVEGENATEQPAPWNGKIPMEDEDLPVDIVWDEAEENIYFMIMRGDDEENCFVYHYSVNEGKTEKIPLKEIIDIPNHEYLYRMLITPDNELVFFTERRLADGDMEHVATVLFDPISKKVIEKQEFIYPGSGMLCFGENKEIYYLDQGQQCIIEKKFGSDDIQSVIPCQDMCEIDWNSKLDVKDGVGVLYTASGIYSGEMSGENWHQVISSNDYFKDEQEYYIGDFYMVSADEPEYYVEIILEDNETFKWVHYY